jgi:uncharacterized membrane protein YccC
LTDVPDEEPAALGWSGRVRRTSSAGRRAFVTIGFVELFWIVTEWPNGAFAITFAAIVVLLLAPLAERAYAAAMRFMIGLALATGCTAIIAFAVLPGLETFEAFSLAIGLYLIPAGALVAQPWQTVTFTAMVLGFVPLLSPANQMSYDTIQFYNFALAIVAGSGAAALSFRLLPPLSPAFRARRLLALTLRDLRRLATGPALWTADDWEGRICGRLAAPRFVHARPKTRMKLLTGISMLFFNAMPCLLAAFSRSLTSLRPHSRTLAARISLSKASLDCVVYVPSTLNGP